jgi:DNA-binding MarR family transcriptional regulator
LALYIGAICPENGHVAYEQLPAGDTMATQFEREGIGEGDGAAPAQDKQLEAIRREVQRLSQMLDALPAYSPNEEGLPYPSSPVSFEQGRAAEAARLYKERRLRERFFPADLFTDPAWDMLLDLYIAHYRKKEVGASSLCLAARVPRTTAHRWIDTMEHSGLIKRSCDHRDRRRIFIELSENARLTMDRYFDQLA